ncbi:apolipoprotein D-like [Callorhinchus milii]|uniref:Apolipoprotein D-like n=1 Tax=Callorhinchus milii TaxID=7868 RepID=A0A4W3HWD5_CALMI|nr:apolipoprotein D-like [Callorhinchus milii]|eukprot:gi/632933988/ref/XP_007895524.1/ PREDICTED: apolipoprotein D-like [Callorhinchus milii]
MQEMLWTLLVTSLCFTTTRVQAACAKPEVQKDFNFLEYLGTWFEIQRSSNVDFENGKCIATTYSRKSPVALGVRWQELVDKKVKSHDAELYPTSTKEPAKLFYSSTSPFKPSFEDFPYWVLSTDYKNYSLVYSCFVNLGIFSTQSDHYWIFSRQMHLPENTTNQLHEILASYNIATKNIATVDHEDCSSFI